MGSEVVVGVTKNVTPGPWHDRRGHVFDGETFTVKDLVPIRVEGIRSISVQEALHALGLVE